MHRAVRGHRWRRLYERRWVSSSPDGDLKPRELEILQLLADGLTDRAIASRLDLAADTVRWYNKQLYLRLGVSSRGDAVRRARELGLLQKVKRAAARASVERSPIRYANNAGVSIAYQVVGSGARRSRLHSRLCIPPRAIVGGAGLRRVFSRRWGDRRAC